MQRRKLTDIVYQELRADILSRKFRYGEYLPSIAMLCDQYQAGRNTIRSALSKLTADELILQEKGKNALIVFGVHKTRDYHLFIQNITGKAPYLPDVYKTMELLIPSTIYCLKNADKEQFQTLKLKLRKLRNHESTDKREFINNLTEIYIYAFGLGKNEYISDLLMTFLRYTYVELPNDLYGDEKRSSMKDYIFKMVNAMFEFLIIGNQTMLKKTIQLMMKRFSKGAEEIIQYVSPLEEHAILIPFVWRFTRSHDYLYISIVTEILKDIETGIYAKQRILPSFEQMAKHYHVSIHTVRKAIEILNDYHVIHTVNGIGSYISLFHHMENETTIYHNSVKECVMQFHAAVELLTLCVYCLEKDFFKHLSLENIALILDQMETKKRVLLPILDVMFQKNVCLEEVFRELKQHLHWNLCIRYIVPVSNIQIDTGLKSSLITALKNHQYKECMQVIHVYLQYAIKFADIAVEKVMC